MKYTPLKNLYYQNPEKWESIYSRRFDAPHTRHFPVNIRQYNHPSSYPAFLCYTEEMAMLLQSIYKKQMVLMPVLRDAPSVMLSQFTQACLLEEIQSTNEIEGVRSTKSQIRAVMTRDRRISDSLHLRSVVDKYKKILSAEQIDFSDCASLSRFYRHFVLDEVVSENEGSRPDGKLFRKEPVDIQSAVQKTIHRGLWPESEIISAMDSALAILHEEEKTPALVRIAVFHYLFGYIHPFYDGNGRTGRFIASYYLAREFNRIIAVKLSSLINKNKGPYYEIFQSTNNEYNRGDLTPFVLWFMKIVEQSFSETIAVLERKIQQLQNYSVRLDSLPLGDALTRELYFILLQASLFEGEGATMKDLTDTTEKTYVTVKNRLREMPPDHLWIISDRKPFRYKLNIRQVFYR